MMLNGSGQRNSQQIANQSTTMNTNGSNGLNLQSNSNSSLMMNGNGQSSERPVFPPPPIPDHHKLSDLQQIQQQLIRKYDNHQSIMAKAHANNGSNGSEAHNDQSYNNNGLINNGNNADLPPPPSPPNFNDLNAKTNMVTISMNALTIQQQTKQQDLSDSSMFDMPLPPPPLDLQDSGHSNPHLHTNGNNYFYDKPW